MAELGQPMHTEDVALFGVPPVNVAEDKIMWVEHLPTFGKGGKSAIQFNIPGTGNQYTDLSQTRLNVKISIQTKDGHYFPQNQDLTTALPINNVLHSLWSMVDIKLNQSLVSTSGNNYMYKAYIETLLNYDRNAKEYQLRCIGFTNEYGNFDETDPDNMPQNVGLVSRYNWFLPVSTKYTINEGTRETNIPQDGGDTYEIYPPRNVITFTGPLAADICNQSRLILNGVDIDIRLFPTRDEFRLIVFPDGTEARIELEDIKLEVCKVNIASNTVLGIENTLLETPALYPLARSEVRTFNMPKGSYGEVLEDMFQGEVPSRLVIGLVDSEAYVGNMKHNPYRFNHYDISTLAFYVDGEPTPGPPMEFNFREGDCLNGLISLYDVSGKSMLNTDLGITLDQYIQGLALFGINVDPTSSANLDYLGQPKNGRTRLMIRLKKPLPTSATIIVYAVFPEVMQIDHTRLVCLREKEQAVARLQGRQQLRFQPTMKGVPKIA